MEEPRYIEGALVFLLAVVVAVPLFERFKLGAVLAYLVAGAVLGPHGLGLMRSNEESHEVAELGVVLLLFLIGLELSYARLWLMRRAVFGLGALQVVLTTAAMSVVAFGFGLDWRAALVAGFALSMSSTAIGVQLLSDRRELGEAHGRSTLAVLLFQDLVAIPAIALLPLLARGEAAPAWTEIALATGKVVLALAVVVAAGRLLLRPVFRIVARTSSVEAFTAMTLLVVLGTAWLTSLAGVSMAFGAFLAGVLLAESEYRHEIEANIEPFKGLLLGLFFVTVGVSVDWFLVAQHVWAVALGVVLLLAVKFTFLYLLGRTSGPLDRPGALRLAALLAQGGEFAFLLLTIAARRDLLPGADRDQITAVVVISMALTPLLVLGIDRWLARRAAAPARPFDDPSGDEAPRVIIAGFGRVGQIVARLLTAHRIPFTALEHSVDQVELSRRFGNVIYYGDPTRPELLRAARADRAEIFVLATDDPDANVRTARLVKRQFPHLKVYARARNRQHAFRLMDLELDAVVRETLHSSLELSRHVLIGLGLTPAQAAERVERFRRHDERMLEAQQAVYDDETKLVQSAKEAMAELEQLFEADLRDDALTGAAKREATRET
jgi:glutathione-regulated potassium-efflux system protein KefB